MLKWLDQGYKATYDEDSKSQTVIIWITFVLVYILGSSDIHKCTISGQYWEAE